MDTKTGAIAQFERRSDATRAGYDLPLTAAQAKEASGMSRKQRREWARNNANGAAREIDRLKKRVQELEAEVARLSGKAGK